MGIFMCRFMCFSVQLCVFPGNPEKRSKRKQKKNLHILKKKNQKTTQKIFQNNIKIIVIKIKITFKYAKTYFFQYFKIRDDDGKIDQHHQQQQLTFLS